MRFSDSFQESLKMCFFFFNGISPFKNWASDIILYSSPGPNQTNLWDQCALWVTGLKQ